MFSDSVSISVFKLFKRFRRIFDVEMVKPFLATFLTFVVLATFFVACSSRRSPYSVDDDEDDDNDNDNDGVLNLRPTDEDFEDFERELFRDKQRTRFDR